MKNSLNLHAGRLPTEEQLLMLRAALLPKESGFDAALAWLEIADIQRLDKASRRLLPLLHDKFRNDGIEHPLMGILKGVKRHTWYNNRLLFHQGGQAVRKLLSDGVDVMILKGAAMVSDYYHDDSMRPMEDLDLLVRYTDARKAVNTLLVNGWQVRDRNSNPTDEFKFKFEVEKGCHFVHATGVHLDLHWNLMHFCLGPNADEDYWVGSRSCLFEGQTVHVLNSSDQLLHILVHGSPWSTTSPIRWIPDAFIVLTQSIDFSWSRLVEQAKKRELSLMVSRSLHYFKEQFPILVPQKALKYLDAQQNSLMEIIEYWNITRPKPKLGLVEAVIRVVCEYNRYVANKNIFDKFIFLPCYFEKRWGIRRFEMPLYAFKLTLKKLIP